MTVHAASEIDIRDPRMHSAASVFERLLADGEEIGGAFSVRRNGHLLVRGWGGTAAKRGQAWSEQTLVQVYSTGKPFVAIAALLAVRDGALTLDDPVTRWWPEYRDHTERRTTLRMILNHTSGKHAFPASTHTVPATHTADLIRALAESEPLSVPGAAIIEHAVTYGHLVDGLLAAAGAPCVAERTAALADALGIDLYFAVPESARGRVARLEVTDPEWVATYQEQPIARQALTGPVGLLDPDFLSGDDWLGTDFGAVGLRTSADALAAFYDDVRSSTGVVGSMLGRELYETMLAPSAEGRDGFTGGYVEWALGFRVDDGEIGMGGIGGSAAWYSLTRDYSMAYVTRGLAGHERVTAVADAVEDALTSTD